MCSVFLTRLGLLKPLLWSFNIVNLVLRKNSIFSGLVALCPPYSKCELSSPPQACYGILKVPQGNWLCRTCALGVQPKCLLCPKRGGALKPTRSGTKWVHVSCALWIPEVRSYERQILPLGVCSPAPCHTPLSGIERFGCCTLLCWNLERRRKWLFTFGQLSGHCHQYINLG